MRRYKHLVIILLVLVITGNVIIFTNMKLRQSVVNMYSRYNNDERSIKPSYKSKMDFTCNPNHTAKYSNKSLQIVALFSNPGSGNTWTRHLIERATGIVTGSWFCSPSLQSHFKGECQSFTRNTVATKTHLPVTDAGIDKIIMLLRDPKKAIYTEYKRAYHLPYPKRKQTKQFFRDISTKWTECWARIALRVLSGYPGPLLLIRYENLRNNLEHEMRKIVNFLGIPVSEERFQCMLQYREGPFRRSPIVTAEYDEVIAEPPIEALYRLANEAVEQALNVRGCLDDKPCTRPSHKTDILKAMFQEYNRTAQRCNLYREYNFACSCPQRVKHACICANGTVFKTKMKRPNHPPNTIRNTSPHPIIH